MNIYIMQIQYLNEDGLEVGSGDWPREEVILVGVAK